MACRINRTEEWAIRIEHELHGKDGCFVTLTYDDSNLPEGNTLVKSDLQKFIKRLRWHIAKPIKYYACGEYGENTDRAHYHMIIIGWIPEDVYVCPNKRCSSGMLAGLWSAGFVSVDPVTDKSIRYVTGYIRKKLYGDMAKEYGERTPPFALMSLGIGKEFADRNMDKMEKGFMTKNGRKVPIPRYYKERMKKDPDRAWAMHVNASINKEKMLDDEVSISKAENLASRKALKAEFTKRENADNKRRSLELKAKSSLVKKGRL